MKARHIPHAKRQQAGFSLIELLVSVAISMVVMIAMMQVLLGSLQTDRTTSDVARMQESGRNALDLLGRAIRQAGARTNVNVLFSGAAVAGINNASPTSTANTPDTITLQYEAQGGGELDCAGNTVAAGTVMTFAFAVDTVAKTLTCNGTVVANNIEDMQINYGIDAAKDGTLDSYKALPADSTEFGQVAAVQVSLVVRGSSAGVAANASQIYTLNGATVTKTDGFLRQIYSATFTVRNQAG